MFSLSSFVDFIKNEFIFFHIIINVYQYLYYKMILNKFNFKIRYVIFREYFNYSLSIALKCSYLLQTIYRYVATFIQPDYFVNQHEHKLA